MIFGTDYPTVGTDETFFNYFMRKRKIVKGVLPGCGGKNVFRSVLDPSELFGAFYGLGEKGFNRWGGTFWWFGV